MTPIVNYHVNMHQWNLETKIKIQIEQMYLDLVVKQIKMSWIRHVFHMAKIQGLKYLIRKISQVLRIITLCITESNLLKLNLGRDKEVIKNHHRNWLHPDQVHKKILTRWTKLYFHLEINLHTIIVNRLQDQIINKFLNNQNIKMDPSLLLAVVKDTILLVKWAKMSQVQVIMSKKIHLNKKKYQNTDRLTLDRKKSLKQLSKIKILVLEHSKKKVKLVIYHLLKNIIQKLPSKNDKYF